MTNQMGRNSKARRSLDKVCRNARTSTFRSDDHAFRPGSFDPVYPRPAIPRPCSYLAESVLEWPVPGLLERDAGTFPDYSKYALQWLHNRLKPMRQLKRVFRIIRKCTSVSL